METYLRCTLVLRKHMICLWNVRQDCARSVLNIEPTIHNRIKYGCSETGLHTSSVGSCLYSRHRLVVGNNSEFFTTSYTFSNIRPIYENEIEKRNDYMPLCLTE